MNTIFDKLSLDRSIVKWDEYLHYITPVQQIGNIFIKRDDFFAPLGYGGINGSKLRQCIWLIKEYVNDNGSAGIISGASVKSPQLSMGSAVALHFKLPSIHVIGATKPNTAIKHSNVAMASWFGASFHIVPNIAYNPVLQKKVRDIRPKDYFYLEYGITLDHKINSQKRVEAFHKLGSEQVINIPDHIENLIIPAGSCNSCTSILYGIARFRPKNLKNVYLIGIGPNKIDLIEERLDIIQNVSGVYTKPFVRNYENRDIQQRYDSSNIASLWDNVGNIDNFFNLFHHDLHSTGYITYQQEVNYNYHSIELHSTYEAKVMKYVHEKLPELLNDKTLFWIVGSKPSKEAMYDVCKDYLGPYPEKIREYEYARISA